MCHERIRSVGSGYAHDRASILAGHYFRICGGMAGRVDAQGRGVFSIPCGGIRVKLIGQ